jgi:flagellar basal-body rod protein FlgB
MSLFDTTQIALEQAMRGAAMRQSVLSNNLSNINTPGYQRQDVDFHSALRAALGAGAAGDGSLSSVSFSPVVDRTGAARLDGNGVDADRESADLAENGLEYESLVSVAKGRIDIIEAALGRG